MRKIIKALILCLLLSSCCREDSIETDRFNLETDELAILPYQNEGKINFVHSEGYAFDFNVIEDKLKWEEHHNFCEWNCCGNDYFSYQVKTSILESTYPKFHIEFSLGGNRIGEYTPQVLYVEINNSHIVQFPYDTLTNFICDTVSNTLFYDSISLNNKTFYDVFKGEFDSYRIYEDSSVLIPRSLYYNNLGMIQLEMTNNETYTINN